MKWGMIVGGLMEWLLSRMTIKIAAPVKNWEVKFARHANSTVIKKSTGEVCPGKSHHGEVCPQANPTNMVEFTWREKFHHGGLCTQVGFARYTGRSIFNFYA